MDINAYIESGIIESYLLGLATREEVSMLLRMRVIYPELETEISAVERKLQKVGLEGGVTPPAQIWNKIVEQLRWQGNNGSYTSPGTGNGHDGVTYINIQPRNNTITVNIWWRCAFIAVCMVVMALVASTVYFYQKYHQLEQQLLRLYPATETAAPVVK